MSRTNRDLNLQTPQNSALESTAKDLQPAPSPRVNLVGLALSDSLQFILITYSSKETETRTKSQVACVSTIEKYLNSQLTTDSRVSAQHSNV